MRQMPSVTDTTVPWVRICAVASMFWMRLLMSSEISDGLSCIWCSLCFQCGLQRRQLRARRAVDDLVADDDLDSADQGFVHADLGAHLAAGLFLQSRHEVGGLRRIHLERAVNLSFHHALALILQ